MLLQYLETQKAGDKHTTELRCVAADCRSLSAALQVKEAWTVEAGNAMR